MKAMSSSRLELLHLAKAVLLKAIQDDTVELLDAFGRPIRKDSPSHIPAQEASRKRMHQLLDDLLDYVPSDAGGASDEEIATAAEQQVKASMKYEFDVVDGKLTLPFRIIKDNVAVKGHIPVYKVALLVAGVWTAHQFLRARRDNDGACAPAGAPGAQQQEPTPPPQCPIVDLPGARYQEAYLTESQERTLIGITDEHPWRTDLQRRVQHYGYIYNYKQRTIAAAAKIGPLPDWLQELALRLVTDNFFPTAPDQAIINEYQPGQGISAHVDCIPCFGPTIATLSLGSSCVMQFTKRRAKQTIEQIVQPRSVLLLTGEARYQWTHAIPARKTDTMNGTSTRRARRLSITFRTVLAEQ
jgi:alkylated DNA repair dioxygenase AlkB